MLCYVPAYLVYTGPHPCTSKILETRDIETVHNLHDNQPWHYVVSPARKEVKQSIDSEETLIVCADRDGYQLLSETHSTPQSRPMNRSHLSLLSIR